MWKKYQAKKFSPGGRTIRKLKKEKDGRRWPEKETEAEIDQHADQYNDIYAVLLFLISLAVYSTTCYRTIPGGDSAELIVASQELGIPHPPGYPLIAIALKIWNLPATCINKELIAFSSALFSSFIAALSNVSLFQLLNLTCKSTAISILGVTVFGFSTSTWEWASNLEVFTLNNLLCTRLLISLCNYMNAKMDGCQKEIENGVFWSAVCLTNQHTSILYIVPISIYVLWKDKKLITYKFLTRLVVIAGVPLSLYLYLPLSSFFSKARWTWGSCDNINGLLTHVLRSEYGTFSLASVDHTTPLLRNLKANFDHCTAEFGYPVTFLGLAGNLAIIFTKKLRKYNIFLTLFWFYTLFFAWRANLDPSNQLYYGVIKRFFLQNSIILIMKGCILLNEILKYFKMQIHDAMAFPILVICSSYIIYQSQFNDYSNKTIVKEFADIYVESFAPNAVILMKGDLPSNTFRYLEIVEEKRPDLIFIDTQPMTYSWYLEKQRSRFSGLTFPGNRYHLEDAGTFTLKDLIRANPTKTYYGCFDLQELETFNGEFLMIPWGSCDQIYFLPNSTIKAWSPDFIPKGATSFLNGWKYEMDYAVAAHSWDKVALEEMVNAQGRIGNWAYQKALESQRDGKEFDGIKFLIQSYFNYKSAMVSVYGRIPTNWYKNTALIHPKLVNLGVNNAPGSYEESISYFKSYLDQSLQYNEVIDDRPEVQKAISNMQAYLNVRAYH